LLETVPQFEQAGRGGFMRRFLTLVCLLCVAIPAGISISGCTRNPAGNYCNGLGYGLKDTDVASIFMSPQSAGISIAFGQTQQVAAPTAKTCKGTTASVSAYTFGTTNNQLVDISPTGNICAGTWNRNTGGGILNYTICSFPNPLPSTKSLPYGSAYVTASANSVTSNPVEVYVHPQVTHLTLVGPQSCLSQDTLWNTPLDVQGCFVGAGGQQQLLCAPPSVTTAASPALACPLLGENLASIPDCTAALGTLTYSVGNGSVASINAETNQITAELPGTSIITASIAGGASSAGYFSTCPPASISVTLANGDTSGSITQGVAQNLITTVYDNNIDPSTGLGHQITGLTLDYQSTDPIDISVGATGGVNTNFPGVASITAICQPSTCNPAPINEVGLNGTGLSISSNPVTITTPGTASDYAWFSSPGQSQYFVPIELLSGTIGTSVRLPYVPNSMLMDRLGTTLYFGSAHELMSYNTSSNSLTKQDTNAPGVVLAVSPTNAQLLVNDQVRHLFYLYSSGGSGFSNFGGMGAAAQWTPDGKTLYVFDNANLNSPSDCPATPLITGHTDTLYVYNIDTGWSTYSLPPSPLPAASLPTCTTQPNTAPLQPIQIPAITVPGVGAYLSGNPTVAHTWCPTGTVANGQTVISEFYPQAQQASVPVQTDVLAATTDGKHILGAALDGTVINLSDIGVSIPSTTSPAGVVTPDACPVSATGVMSPLEITSTLTGPFPVTGVTATTVNQVVPSPNSSFAFITYSGDTASALLPYYVTGTGVKTVALTGGAAVTAPLVGAFAPDGTIFFVGTAGDDEVHYITIPTTVNTGTAPTDTQQVKPNLPACVPNGNDAGCVLPTTYTNPIVPVTAIEVKPRSTT
jgi:trimeric autotransporter adhesin